MLPPDNPQDIESLKDLVEKRVRIVNRTSGAGTRILFDHLLGRVAEELDREVSELKREIPGYEVELSTHNAIAAAVRDGKAGAGLGIKTVAESNGLDFLELQREEFDFLCRQEALETEFGKEFREALAGERFQELLKDVPGLHPREGAGEVVFTS